MKVIYKYSLPVEDEVNLMLPVGACVLHVGCQDPAGRVLQVWAMVGPDEPLESWSFRIRGTGHPLGEDIKSWHHLASVMAGPFVWHVFLEPGRPQETPI